MTQKVVTLTDRERWLSRAEAASFLGVGGETVDWLVGRGHLTPEITALGRHFDKEQLTVLLARREATGRYAEPAEA
jgi:hypothetical protein